MFKSSSDYIVHKMVPDREGNYIFLDISIQGYRLTLGSVYGPNKDDPKFYEHLGNEIQDLGNCSIIIAGDWNLVQNFAKDTKGYLHHNNPKACEALEQMQNKYDLVDIWRIMHPNERKFTWHQHTLSKFGRLDYFSVTSDIQSETSNSDISYGYKIDHSLTNLFN